jgi:hypothetical protein
VSESLLDHLRYPREEQLLALLFDRFGLDALVDHHLESGEANPWREVLLGSQLRLTPLLSPRLFGLLGEVVAILGFEEPVDLFVAPSAEINAFSIHGFGGHPHAISLHSGLIERMDDDELRFVLGHEVGHLAWRHYRARMVPLALGEEEDGTSRVPPLLARRLESWDRLAELSADRAGFAAAGGDLDHIVRCFFKLVSGLGPEHLRIDISAFLAQLEDLRRLERRDVLATFSHPATPVRVRALQLLGEIGGVAASTEDLARIDEEVAGIARLMELQVSEPVEIASRDFLKSAGMLAAAAGGRTMTAEQAELLLHMVLPLAADPEAELAAITSQEEAEVMLAGATGWLREHAGAERFALFAQIAHVATVDGYLGEGEHAFLLDLAGRLAVPEKEANRLIYDALGTYVDAQARQKRPSFRLDDAGEPS